MVLTLTESVENKKSNDERKRDGRERNKGGAKIEQKQEQYDRDKDRTVT